MVVTLVSRAATALLLGSQFVAAIDVDMDDASMTSPGSVNSLVISADFDSSFDQKRSGNDRVRYDELLQRKCIRRNNRSLTWPSSESVVGL
jgi:hypothetical protein